MVVTAQTTPATGMVSIIGDTSERIAPEAIFTVSMPMQIGLSAHE
jgi:hypothetical protein